MSARIPTSAQAVIEKSPNGAPLFTRPWYRFLQAMAGSGASPQAIAVGASPYEYTSQEFGTVIVSGGAVTLLELGRGGAFTDLGVIAGPVPVSPSDVVRVTHAGAPTMTLVQR